MDAKVFKSKLVEMGINQTLAALLMKVPLGTLKSWLNRGEVPDDAVAKLVADPVETAVQPVAEAPVTVAEVAKVTPPKEVVMVRVADDLPGPLPNTVAIPSAEKGHEEFDIMADGWARGFAKDATYLRTYRTAHAIRRFAEKRLEEFRTKALTQEFWGKHSETVESRLAFFKKLAGVK